VAAGVAGGRFTGVAAVLAEAVGVGVVLADADADGLEVEPNRK
jgi:hypothetical protein